MDSDSFEDARPPLPPKPPFLQPQMLQQPPAPPQPPPPDEGAYHETDLSSTELQQTVSIAAGERPRDYHSIEREAPQALEIASPSPKSGARCKCRFIQKASYVDHVAYFCALSVFAYLGMLARVYLSELVVWDGLPLFPSFYPEVVGTTIMGALLSHKGILERNHKLTYQALTTGLCGSITTFSSWSNDAATVLIQYGNNDADNVTRVLGWATILIVGFGMPVVALKFGEHLGFLSPWADCHRTAEDVYSHHGSNRMLKAFEIATYISLWLATTVVAVVIPLILYGRHDFMFSFMLASLGAYLRWHLSPWNTLSHHFRLGTFVANTLGTWLLGTAYLLDHHHEEEAGAEVKGLLYGMTAGFCGCLTTVSTFAVELHALTLPSAYVYGLVSVLVAQVGLVTIRGVYWWTR